MFPAKFERYIEVFGGGGWVLFGKPPNNRGMEVYNDFNLIKEVPLFQRKER